MKTKIFLILFYLLLTNALFADQTYQGNWDGIAFTSKQEKGSPFYYFKTDARFFNDHNIDELLMRPAIGYMLTKNLGLWLGYDFTQSILDSSRIRHGIWEQAQLKIKDSDALNIVCRNRLEERFNTEGQGTALRDRTRAVVIFKNALKNDFSPLVYDELFFNLNHPEWVSKKTISQNRIFVGIEKQLDKTTDVMIGYLNRSFFNTRDIVRDNLLSIEFEVKFS